MAVVFQLIVFALACFALYYGKSPARLATRGDKLLRRSLYIPVLTHQSYRIPKSISDFAMCHWASR